MQEVYALARLLMTRMMTGGFRVLMMRMMTGGLRVLMMRMMTGSPSWCHIIITSSCCAVLCSPVPVALCLSMSAGLKMVVLMSHAAHLRPMR